MNHGVIGNSASPSRPMPSRMALRISPSVHAPMPVSTSGVMLRIHSRPGKPAVPKSMPTALLFSSMHARPAPSGGIAGPLYRVQSRSEWQSLHRSTWFTR